MIVKLKRVDSKRNWGAKDSRGRFIDKFEHCKDYYPVGINKHSGQRITGLEDDPDKDEGKKRLKLENLLSMKKDTLLSTSDYWDNFKFTIPGGGISLNTDNPLHQLYLTILNADKTIAKSSEELRVNPKAEFILIDDESEAKNKNLSRKIKSEAWSLFEKMSKNDIVNVLTMYGLNVDSTTPEQNESILGDYIEKDPKQFIDKAGDKEIKTKVMIVKAVNRGIILKSGINVFTSPLSYQGNNLGGNIDEVISFLKDKNNQAIFLSIQTDLK